MNVKIQGGGSGNYANTGSSFAAFNYLNHENKERSEKGLTPENFFNGQDKEIDFSEMVKDIDQNKGQLGKKDAKFFVLTISPSDNEQRAIGRTEAERSASFKKFIKEEVMEEYAKAFGKGLTAHDIKWYAKIHHGREGKEGNQMHAHIIVSRKDIENKLKLSPMTNHRAAERSGTVKSGFNRSAFFETIENNFDGRFQYRRDISESFKYCNTMKRGTVQEKVMLLDERATIQADQLYQKERESLQGRSELGRDVRMNFLKTKIRTNSKFSKAYYELEELRLDIKSLDKLKNELEAETGEILKKFEKIESSTEKHIKLENELKNAKIEPKKPKQRNRNLSREEEDLEL
jgi:hypothetical protein